MHSLCSDFFLTSSSVTTSVNLSYENVKFDYIKYLLLTILTFRMAQTRESIKIVVA